MALRDHYIIKETLHESDTVMLCRGVRQQDGVPVIIKTLRAASPTPRQVEYLRQEYELGRQIDSPYVVKPYALEKHEARLSLILADFGGDPLSGRLGTPLAVDRFLDLAIQLAAALADNVVELMLGKLKRFSAPTQQGLMLAELYEFAKRGDIRRIRDEALRLEKLGERYLPFAHRLRELVEGYQVGAILALVEQYKQEG